jgi:hypothetical protein
LHKTGETKGAGVMSWETRGNRRYYYSAEKRDGRVVKHYVGRGEVAGAVATIERIDREREQGTRAPSRRDEEQADRLDRLDRLIGEVSAVVDRLVNEALTEAGYHRHHRGAWRKRRGH